MAQEGTLYKKDSFEFLRIYLYIAVMGYRFEPRSLTFKASKRMYGINSYILYFAFNTIPHYCKYKIRWILRNLRTSLSICRGRKDKTLDIQLWV